MLGESSLYFSLILALPTTAAMTLVHEAGKHRDDWVWTPATLMPVVVLIGFKDVLIILAYIHILDFCDHAPILTHVTFWILSLSGLALHFLADKLMGPFADRGVTAKLAALKDAVARSISRNPNGFEMLTTSLDLADIPEPEKQKVLNEITGKTLHAQAIAVIRVTGLPIPLQIVKSRQEKL
jgi:hypothetical protein